jgi:hypothetical protein
LAVDPESSAFTCISFEGVSREVAWMSIAGDKVEVKAGTDVGGEMVLE